jgi:RNA polymerase sigma factor (sigma-70 family)
VGFSDAELLNGIISSDKRILKEIYTLYFPRIRKYVLLNSGADEDVRDLFQDTLLVLFQKARGGDFRLTCSLGTYLYSVSRFLWLKELSRRKFTHCHVEELENYVDPDTDIVAISEMNERLLYYRKCFEKLSTGCRKVLSLFAEGYSITRITEMLGFKSEQHTKNRRYRCKLMLIRTIRSVYNFSNTNQNGNSSTDREIP